MALLNHLAKAIALTTPLVSTMPLLADDHLDEMTIIGDRSDTKAAASSAVVIDSELLSVFKQADINKILAAAPGVYAAAEEGFGLRPNIGIRGSGTSRSSKITLLEDGVLVAPAPYSNPDAYYFPTTSRMVGVEVLKGAPILRYGPATVGGVLNLVSTPIPQKEFGGKFIVEGDSNTSSRLNASVGGQGENIGWLIEGQRHESNGFHNIDRANKDAGFLKQDLMAKLSWKGQLGSFAQRLDVKAHYTEESSNMSYFGLTDADFNADPDRRYGLTELDNMANDRTSFSANYELALSDSMQINLLAYQAKFQRDWFKVDKINGISGSRIFDEINTAGADSALYQGWLDGTADIADIDYKHNNRAYTSEGIQTELSFEQELFGSTHSVVTGIRIHGDEMDRFQPVESYQQVNGQLQFVSSTHGNVTGSNNRLESADALSLWIVDEVKLTDALNITLSARNEDMETERLEYSDNDRNIAPSQRQNTADEWLFGSAFTYALTDEVMILGGVQEGLTPISGGSKPPTAPEMSTNYELGARFNTGMLSASAIAFYSDYSSTVQYCSNAHPCDNGATSGSLSLGESEVNGFEFSVESELAVKQWLIPMQFNYTYTQAEITKSEVAGAQEGDSWAYIPESQWAFMVGIESTSLPVASYLQFAYQDGVCTTTGCERTGAEFAKTDDLLTVDWATRYMLTDDFEVYFNISNLFDERAIAARSPYGARSNMPRTASLGAQFNL